MRAANEDVGRNQSNEVQRESSQGKCQASIACSDVQGNSWNVTEFTAVLQEIEKGTICTDLSDII